MEGADARARRACQLDGADLGLINGAARSVGGKYGRMSAFDHALQSQQAFAGATGTGAARGPESEQLQSARDELAVEAAADNDGCPRMPKVKGAGKHALVPETKNLRSRSLAIREWRGAVLGDGLEAPGVTHQPQERPHHARRHSQNNALAEGECAVGFAGH